MKTVATPNAPGAIGPYSQACISGNLLFTAGQIPLVPGSMELVTGPIEAQTGRVVANLAAVLEAAGTDWSHVLKTTVFLTDLAEFGAFNAVYEKLLGGAKPARSTVQVAALPRGAKVEIELVAEIPADA
ncbi:RidA family protein [Geothrix sp. 21YS21S-2]|uniref:RidA family protein n=1 Tax=Geothrix sp. 21YS21S-2 TaxID=3068893 RepID=UPI0027B95F84|nr:RidA family protein [Geothrix sp. 21YS21S-2]